MTRVIRVGGVAEPFNLPWIKAFETGAFEPLGVEVVFTEYAGGTGAMVDALEAGEIDLATLLTEGAVTARGRGRDVAIHSMFTRSPLVWGVHVAAESAAESVSELTGCRFAISRFGSGSELMAYVLADRHGWELDESDFVVVGGIDGAVRALPAGEAEVFLWERFVTAPLVESGVFARVGDLATPWSAFVTAGRAQIVDGDRDLIDAIVAVVCDHATRLVADRPGTAAAIADRYGMAPADIESWLDLVAWPDRPMIDTAALDQATATMVTLDRL